MTLGNNTAERRTRQRPSHRLYQNSEAREAAKPGRRAGCRKPTRSRSCGLLGPRPASHSATMTLTESYMRGILRPPPADPTALPPNPPHPFQKSFTFYLKNRFLKYHFPLVLGYGASIWLFMSIDEARRNAQKASYDKAISEGHSPFGHH